MIDQDSHVQQAAETRRMHETVSRLAAERQRLVEDLAAARQRANEEAAAAAPARAEAERLHAELRRLKGEFGVCLYPGCDNRDVHHGCGHCEQHHGAEYPEARR